MRRCIVFGGEEDIVATIFSSIDVNGEDVAATGAIGICLIVEIPGCVSRFVRSKA